ncbi:MAG: methyl-accepting chemotaxis protein [Reichenbachiella sp.]
MKYINKIPLSIKLIAAFLIAGIAPLLYTADTALTMAAVELENKAFSQLESIQKIKSNQINGFFSERISDVEVLSSNPTVISAVSVFENAFMQTGLNGSDWKNANIQYGPWLEEYMEKYGYYDLFLIAEDGDIIYTVAKESDFGKNVITGKLKSSPLGIAFAKAKNESALSDFAPYEPSNFEPAGFVAAPIFKGKAVVGVVALQISTKAINGIMQERTGLGETGETYLVGSDLLMRSDSYLDPINHSITASFKNPTLGSVKTDATQEALAGKSDSKIIIDYNGNPVLSVYSLIKIKDITWVSIAEIDEAEAFAVIGEITGKIKVSSIWVIVILAISAWLLAFSIAKPIKKIFKGLKTLSNGELSETSDTFKSIVDNLQGSSSQVSSAATQLSDASQQLSEGASEQSSSLEEISSSLEEVASMSKQNSKNSNESKTLAQSATDIVDGSRKSMVTMKGTMEKIKTSSDETFKIIKTIDEIAFQTNLLALNAAVEAARAGEAGKGFAVVAEEVRNLAQRSAEAAKNTSELIEQSKQNSDEGVRSTNSVSESMDQINEAIVKVSQLVNEVAAASNEQTQGVEQINGAILQLNKVTQSNAANSEETAASSEELNGQASVLSSMVGNMLEILENKKQSQPLKQVTTQPVDRIQIAQSNTFSSNRNASETIPFGTQEALQSF